MFGSKNYKQANPTMREVMKRVVNLDLRDLLPRIHCPTLIIWGAEDRVTPVGMARFFHENIRGSRLQLIDGGDHWVNSRNPCVWNEKVQQFLRDVGFVDS